MFSLLRQFSAPRAPKCASIVVLTLLLGSQAFGQTQLFPLLNQIPITANAPAGLGDVNPYGIAFVPKGIKTGSTSLFNSGDLLVSNFNNANNVAGTGATITRITPQGQLSIRAFPV